MNLQNQNIRKFILSYFENPDPQYAVMLKGGWGCGKTHFIKGIKEEYINVKGNTLKPIYVSLYGKTQVNQITQDIERALYPLLYSKGAETLKKVLQFASKVVLKTDLDLKGNDKVDLSLSSSIDALSLFTKRKDEIEIGEYKALFFDDFERSSIDIKILLGYINYFVEHCGCHVIIIGDENKIVGDNLKTLRNFKEKSIGREFSIQADVESAVEYFLENDIQSVWLKSNSKFICDVFNATQCNNLRILRQCLYDFSMLLAAVDENLIKTDKYILIQFLSTFIITYCEYKGANRECICKLTQPTPPLFNVSTDSNKQERDDLSKFISKYSRINEHLQYDTLNHKRVKLIVNFLDHGFSFEPFLIKLLEDSQKEPSILERLANFMTLTNDEFDNAYDDIVNVLCSDCDLDSYSIGRMTAFIAFFDKKKIHSAAEETVDAIKRRIEAKIGTINTIEELYKIKNEFLSGCSTFMSSYDLDILLSISKFMHSKINEKQDITPNILQAALINITEENSCNLVNLDEELKNKIRPTNSQLSISKFLDAKKFFDSIKDFSNGAISNLIGFLVSHYQLQLNFELKDESDKLFFEDLDKLVSEFIPTLSSVRCYMFEKLSKTISQCINRCSGDTDVQMY
jgi:hypothetical protein